MTALFVVFNIVICIYDKERGGDCQMANMGLECEMKEDIARKSVLAIILQL